MPGRSYSSGDWYRFGFNGMEKDDEVRGEKNTYTTYNRQLDPRIGRWISPDPVFHESQSPYTAFDNNPIYYSDPSGANSECCNFAYGIFKATVEYGTQVAGNLGKQIKEGGVSSLDGNTVLTALKEVDIADIGLEFTDGLLNDAIPDAALEIMKESIDYGYNSKKGFTGKIEFSANNVKNGLINYGIGKATEAPAAVNKKLKNAQNELRRSDNIANNGRVRQAQVDRAASAKKKVNNLMQVKKATDVVDNVLNKPVEMTGVKGKFKQELVASSYQNEISTTVNNATTISGNATKYEIEAQESPQKVYVYFRNTQGRTFRTHTQNGTTEELFYYQHPATSNTGMATKEVINELNRMYSVPSISPR